MEVANTTGLHVSHSSGPSTAPITPNVLVQSPTAVLFSWGSPVVANGIVQEYQLNINETDTGEMFQFTTSGLSIEVGSLHPFYTYTWAVAAVTVEIGPFSERLMFSTPEDGKSLEHTYNNYTTVRGIVSLQCRVEPLKT